MRLNGVTYPLGNGALTWDGEGVWTLVVPVGDALADGVYEVLVAVRDESGNTSTDTSSAELVIDTVAPAVPQVTAIDTNTVTPVISGTATLQPGETLEVTLDGTTYTVGDGHLTIDGSGNWALTVPAVAGLVEGVYDIVATVIDAAGNRSDDASTGELTVDTTAPLIPTVVAQVSSTATPTLQGSAVLAGGEALSVELASVVYTVGDGSLSLDGSGNWSLMVPGVNALADGVYEVVSTVSDAAGNTATDASSAELTIDTVAPAVPQVAAINTNDDTPAITGTATLQPAETLKVTLDGTTYTVGDGNLAINGSGNWTLTVPAANALTDGTYEIVATVTDTAGNTATDASSAELIIDTVAPAVPQVAVANTNTDTPVITGSAILLPGEILEVALDGTTYTVGDGHLAIDGSGNWTLTVPAANALTDGTYEIVARVTDVAGNTATDTSSAELVIDTVAPSAPTVVSQSSNQTTPMIEGTADVQPGDTLSVTVNGVTYTAGDGQLTDNGDGTWAVVDSGRGRVDGWCVHGGGEC